jgi:RNA polymerase sigma-70 factor, ECF subfamily
MESADGRATWTDADAAARDAGMAITLPGVVRISRPEPFETFYRRELPRLVALARALCGNAIADDVAQEAMLAAYRKWDAISSYDKPEAWVRRVCVNLATSHLRRRAVEARAMARLSNRRELPALAVDNEVFWTEVRRLPRRQAQAAALRYVYDLSVADIAATLGVTEGSAKVHLGRGRQALARQFGTTIEEES